MSLRHALYRFYWRAESLLVPELKSSQYHYYDDLKAALKPGSVWLDAGCGHQVFTEWMTKEEAECLGRASHVYGLDPTEENLRKHAGIRDKIVGDATHLPFPSDSFDVISSNMVVEHLPDPASIATEIHRVLKPGGKWVFHTVNARNPAVATAYRIPQGLKNVIISILEGRHEDDVFPVMYRCNTSDDVRRYATQCKFRVASLRLVSSSAVTAALGPIAVLELLWLRWLRSPSMAEWRTNLVVTLEKI